jgi:hypothetical protein
VVFTHASEGSGWCEDAAHPPARTSSPETKWRTVIRRHCTHGRRDRPCCAAWCAPEVLATDIIGLSVAAGTARPRHTARVAVHTRPPIPTSIRTARPQRPWTAARPCGTGARGAPSAPRAPVTSRTPSPTRLISGPSNRLSGGSGRPPAERNAPSGASRCSTWRRLRCRTMPLIGSTRDRRDVSTTVGAPDGGIDRHGSAHAPLVVAADTKSF